MRRVFLLLTLAACGSDFQSDRSRGLTGSGGTDGADAGIEPGSGGESGEAGTGPQCQDIPACAPPCGTDECPFVECPVGTDCLTINARDAASCEPVPFGYACLPECDPNDPLLLNTCPSNLCCRAMRGSEAHVCVPLGWDTIGCVMH